MTTKTTKPSDWRRLVRSVIMLTVLLCSGLTARAADYVIMANSGGTWHFYAYNSSQNANYYFASDVTTFTYSTCVWSGSSGNYFRNSNNTSYGLYYNSNSYLQNRSNPDAFTIATNKIHSSNRYICFYNGTWYTARTNNTYYTSGISDVLYSITGPQAAAWTTPVSISGSQSTFTNLGAFTYSADAAYRPAYYTLTGNGTYYVVEGGTPSSSAPTGSSSGITYTWTLNDGTNDDGHVRINASTGKVTYYSSYASNTNTTIKVTATHTASGATSTNTKTITFNALPVADPTGITATDKRIGQGDVWTADNYTFVVADGYSPYRYVTAESANTSIATVNNTSGTFTVTGVEMGSTTITITAYKQGNSVVAATTTFTLTVAEPQTGVSGGKVILNDYEDHSWSYYSDPNCPIRSLSPADVKITYYGDGIVMTGNADYTASSTDFVQPGNANYVGGAKVNVGGEDENTFIYYKTLERGDATQTAWTYSSGNQTSAASRCPYTTIPNPFQVRPTYGARGSIDANNFTGWRGFQCWRLKSVTGGSVYSAASGGTALTTGAVINGETEIYFAPNSEYGMDVQFEAVWARAYLIKGNQGGANTILSQNVGVERNFMTLTASENYRFNGTTGRRITNIGYPVTISCYYPSGEAPANTGGVVTGNNNDITLGADTKFENVTLSAAAYTLTTSGYDVIIGRGCTSTNVGTVRGISGGSSSAVDYTIRLESGTFGTFALIDNTAGTFSSTVSTRAVFGSDYDRAKSDNSKLSIAASSTIYGGNAAHTFSGSANRNNITYDWLIKSGRVQSNVAVGDAAADKSIYIGNSISGSNANSIQYCGKRRLTMEGGEIASIAGSVNCYGNNYANYGVNDGTWSVMIRLKGGTVRGSIYGAAAYAGASGDRLFLFTGGTVNGWVAGGANGTQSDGGMMYGSSSIYVGGHTSVNSNSSTSVINRAVGGNVFGAGCGYGASSNSGQVTEGTTVVVADEAYVERGVYGGGSYGYTTSTADVFILGGTVDGKSGGVSGTSYSGTITGGVFGGACQNQGGTVNITMTGGEVHTGIHGGSNATGTISGNVTMQVNGGQVGTSSSNANIHGGGYGANTAVNGNVSLTLGASTSATDSVTVFGNVYGGSALGDVNDNANDNTTVTMNKALINGNLFGGALGSGADVTGRITVNVNGGRVNGNVFGGGDAAAYSHGGNFPVVNMTGGLVTNIFGGGKGNTATVTGNPQVTLSGNAHVTGNVYGGGDAAQVTGHTNVQLHD